MQRRGRPKKEVKLESRYPERSRNVKVWFQYPKSPSKVLNQVPDDTPSYWAIESTPDGHRRQKPKPRRSMMENGSLDQLQWKPYSPNMERIMDWKFAAERRENEWRTTSIMSPGHTHRGRDSLEKSEPGDWEVRVWKSRHEHQDLIGRLNSWVPSVNVRRPYPISTITFKAPPNSPPPRWGITYSSCCKVRLPLTVNSRIKIFETGTLWSIVRKPKYRPTTSRTRCNGFAAPDPNRKMSTLARSSNRRWWC